MLNYGQRIYVGIDGICKFNWAKRGSLFFLFCCSSCDLPMGFFGEGGGGGVGRGFDPPPVHISRITNLISI